MPLQLQYPLELSFRLLALSPQVFVRNADGEELAYVRQKLFRLKERVHVHPNQTSDAVIYDIQADRILDFSGQYHIHDANGVELGAVKQHGVRSLWRAGFTISRDGQALFEVTEKSVLTRMLDSLVGEIPVIGWLAGWVLQPTYFVRDGQGQLVMELAKKPALLEGLFEIKRVQSLPYPDEELAVLSLLMIVLLLRTRG